MSERIDKYLFAMRVYKTRSIAAEACKKGRVHKGMVELKPAATIDVGDEISVRINPITRTFRVLKLSENRLGAKLVAEYMQDITTSEQLQLLELAKLANQSGRDRGAGRPTKKDRRDIESFFSQNEE